MDKLEVYGFNFKIEKGKVSPDFPHKDLEQLLNLISFEKLTINEVKNKLEGIARFLQFKDGKFFIDDQDKSAVVGMIAEKKRMMIINLDGPEHILRNLQQIHHKYWFMGFAVIDWSKVRNLTEYIYNIKQRLLTDWEYLTAIAFISDDDTCGVMSNQNDTFELNWHQSDKERKYSFLPPNPDMVKVLREDTLLCFLDPGFKIPPEYYHKLQISLDNCIIIGNNGIDRRLAERSGVKFLSVNQITRLND